MDPILDITSPFLSGLFLVSMLGLWLFGGKAGGVIEGKGVVGLGRGKRWGCSQGGRVAWSEGDGRKWTEWNVSFESMHPCPLVRERVKGADWDHGQQAHIYMYITPPYSNKLRL